MVKLFKIYLCLSFLGSIATIVINVSSGNIFVLALPSINLLVVFLFWKAINYVVAHPQGTGGETLADILRWIVFLYFSLWGVVIGFSVSVFFAMILHYAPTITRVFIPVPSILISVPLFLLIARGLRFSRFWLPVGLLSGLSFVVSIMLMLLLLPLR